MFVRKFKLLLARKQHRLLETLQCASYFLDLQFSRDFSISNSLPLSASFPLLVILSSVRLEIRATSYNPSTSLRAGANFEFNRHSIDLDYRRPVSLLAECSRCLARNAHNARSLIALNACGHGGVAVYCPERADCRAQSADHANVFLHLGRVVFLFLHFGRNWRLLKIAPEVHACARKVPQWRCKNYRQVERDLFSESAKRGKRARVRIDRLEARWAKYKGRSKLSTRFRLARIRSRGAFVSKFVDRFAAARDRLAAVKRTKRCTSHGCHAPTELDWRRAAPSFTPISVTWRAPPTRRAASRRAAHGPLTCPQGPLAGSIYLSLIQSIDRPAGWVSANWWGKASDYVQRGVFKAPEMTTMLPETDFASVRQF